MYINGLFGLQTGVWSFSGSYYEKLKVCRPDEFDVMIMLDVKPSVFKLEWERSPNEGYVKLKRAEVASAMQKSPWSAYMTDDGNYLSPIKIRRRFFELLKEVTKSTGKMKVNVEEHGPAVQLTFTNGHDDTIAEADMVLCVGFPEAWPQHAIVEKKGISPALLEKMKSKGFHVVPKTFAESDVKTWRVSFSVCEKELLLHKIECNAKNVLKFVKFLREKHELVLPGISSYHLKNIFLELALVKHKTTLADTDHFMDSVTKLLSALLDALTLGKLWHFFNSGCNLLLQLRSGDQKKSIKTIEQLLDLLRSNDEEHIKEMIHAPLPNICSCVSL